jgi:hypothetical protein
MLDGGHGLTTPVLWRLPVVTEIKAPGV